MTPELSIVLLNNDPQQAIAQFCEALVRTNAVYNTTSGILLAVDHRTGTTQPLESSAALTQLEVLGLAKTVSQAGYGAAKPKQKFEAAAVFGRALKMPSVRDYFPTINSLVRGPAFAVDGARLRRRPPGLDIHGRVLVVGGAGLLPEADPTFPHLRKLYSGINFRSPVYHANLAGYTCAMFARTAVVGFPMLVLDSRRKSSGKSSCAGALDALLTGAVREPLTYPGTEIEVERNMSMWANQAGPNLIWWDNVRGKTGQVHQIRSQAIAIATTSRSIRVRGMHKVGQPVFDPVLVATMNGARVEEDLADRVVRISMNRPGEGENPRLDPKPDLYALEHRQELLAEILALLDGLELPEVGRYHTRFFEFERIAVAAARRLGLAASFDPALVHTANAFVEEAARLLTHEFERTAQAATFSSLVARIRANPNLRELNGWLATQHGTTNSEPDMLREHFEDMAGSQFLVGDRAIEFVVDLGATRLDQPVLRIKEVK